MSKIINGDVLDFLSEYDGRGFQATVSSLPDAEEMGWSLLEWEPWYKSTIKTIMQYTAPEGYAIFYQTDRKGNGRLYSKASWIIQAAESLGLRVIFHKICLIQEPKTKNLYRPSYTHLLCISQQGRLGSHSFPDVIYTGKKIYPNAIGFDTAKLIFEFLRGHGINIVYDFFCGRGSVSYIGTKDFGFECIGMDIDPEQCRLAQELLSSIDGEIKF